MLFMNDRLVPHRNTSEIGITRAAWLYAIENCFAINVGRIICENIKRCRTKRTVKSFYHGSTITKLINLCETRRHPDLGFLHPSDIGMGVLSLLGPCVGPAGEHAPIITQGKRYEQQRHQGIRQRVQRNEEKIDTLLTQQTTDARGSRCS
ncbi:hypothetical protein A4A49_07133 [Nicotiana attenuata]|uniref:Uncharacterized protein n=1 Tax=Nicotiana attenuata TaxID=49451 RepID=A0A314LB01_NICAT|nr:hypothetical protein A4A49_07133 [Nicotiana attenuata]